MEKILRGYAQLRVSFKRLPWLQIQALPAHECQKFYWECQNLSNSKSMSINKPELIQRVSTQTGIAPHTVSHVLDGILDEIYKSLKQGESISLRDFGNFYIRPGRSQSVFKFNPSQRLRKLFGWSSTYKGDG
jgi:DNA-binding protein HU-beta